MESPIKVIGSTAHIYPFEKHYITLLLKKEIDKVEAECKHQIESGDERSIGLAKNVSNFYVADLKVVLERFEAMPKVPSIEELKKRERR